MKNFRRTHIGNHKLHPSTTMVGYGYEPSLSEGALKPPVFQTSSFVFESCEHAAEFFDYVSGRKPIPDSMGAGGLVYSRFNNPNTEIVEDRLALFGHAETALVTSSGSSAINAVALTFLRPGDTFVKFTPLYGGTASFFNKTLTEWGIESFDFDDGLDPNGMIAALDQAAAVGPVRMVYMETPANPTNAMIDLEMIQDAVDQWSERTGQKVLTVCDNTMLGPTFQRPHDFGIDICVYSLTKYIGGHSDLVAGAITGSREHLAQVRLVRSYYGFNVDPNTAWMIGRSMETLILRMEHSAATGTIVAEWLSDNEHVSRVYHPLFAQSEREREVYEAQCSGPGSTYSFVVKDDRAHVFRILNNLHVFKLAVSLGGTESLITHPASTSHSGVPVPVREAAGITEGLIRISIGLEHSDDLILDLEQAFRT